MKKVDPIERALDAYFELDDVQMDIFAAIVRDRKRRGIGVAPYKPKRGRPAGSKNKTSPELMKAFDTLLPNAATESGL